MVNRQDVDILEKNIRESFRLAKTDILRLEQAIDDINLKIHELEDKHVHNKEKIEKIKNGKTKFYTSIKKKKANKKSKKAKVKVKVVKIKSVAKKTKKKFVASKDGKKVHDVNCVFAKNIQPKKRIYFASKTKALNKGLKPCACLLK
jgi:hypothetical protein